MDRRADRQLYDNAVYFRPACRNSNAPACFLSAEKLDKTDNSMIFIERDNALSKEEIYKKIDVLRDACDKGDDLIAKEVLRSVVPTFKRSEDVNKEIAQ